MIHSARQAVARRSIPLLATVLLVAVGMATLTWWAPAIAHSPRWQPPHDLWGTMLAARRLLHLDPGGLYTPPTELVSFPGAAVVLMPVVALLDALGVGLGLPGPHNPHPGAWPIAGPYEIALSGSVLFAVDAIAERAGVSRRKRLVLAAAEAVALWNVSALWGHPEDAVAMAFLLYGVLALTEGRPRRSAWLAGAAIAVQPLVLLALPVVIAALGWRRAAGYLLRAATPAAALLGMALAANWGATMRAVSRQPNWPGIDHATAWIAVAPRLGHGAVATGPARFVAILLACACGAAAERGWRSERPGPGGPGQPPAPPAAAPGRVPIDNLLWWIAVTLALRCALEPVMVAYYVWPALATALASAAGRWSRLVPTAVAAAALTFCAQLSWPGRWGWWTMILAGLVLVLASARGRRGRPARLAPLESPAALPNGITRPAS